MTDKIKAGWRRLSLLARVAIMLPLALGLGGGVWLAFAQGNDADQDGMDDDFETFYGLDTNNASDVYDDNDFDGLTNLYEYGKTTDPFSQDTDNDEFNDYDDAAISRAYFGWGDPQFTHGNAYIYAAPDWLVAAGMDGAGEWITNPVTAWHVPADASNDTGSLMVEVNRALLTNDAVYAVRLFAHTNATLYLDLAGSNGVVATNLYGNLLDGTGAELELLLGLPFASNVAANWIVLRRGQGEQTIYEGLLYVDEDGDFLDQAQEAQLSTSDHVADSDGDGFGDYD